MCRECKARPLWQLSLMFAVITILLCAIARWV